MERLDDINIEDLPVPYAAVATDFDTGREVWLQSGSLLDAVRASIALPGLFTPAKLEKRWYVDGGLVNPVPVSLCRAMGADIVIAVNLNGELVKNVFDGFLSTGFKTIAWDGTNSRNQLVGSGLYLYQFNVNGSKMTKTMILQK